MSRPISLPRTIKNDISENPSRSPLSCPVPISRTSIAVSLTLVSPQKSVLLRCYRHERLIAIVRPVLKNLVKSMDNSQGKCGRYKSKLRPLAHWFNESVALSQVMNTQMRRRIAAAP